MAGELGDLDEVTRFGHPWHGLWKSAGNVIQTPGGGDIANPGTSPASYGAMRHAAGDCYAIKVPGQPAVTTTPAEAEAGETWLNYALLSGYNRRLYGKNLGPTDWIYVAPDKSVWLAALTFTGPKAGAILLKRFGVMPGAATTQTLTFSLPSADVGGAERLIEDILPDGSQVLVACADYIEDADYYGKMRYFKGAFKLSLAGTPPAATLAAAVEVTYTLADPSYTAAATTTWFKAVWSDVGGTSNLVSTTVDTTYPDFSSLPEFHNGMAVAVGLEGLINVKEPIVGLYFDAAGAVQRVKIKTQTSISITNSATARDNSYVIDISGSGTATTTIVFSLGSESTTYTVSSSFSITGDEPTSEAYSTSFSHVFGAKTGSGTTPHTGAGFSWPVPLQSDAALVVIGAGVFAWIGPTGSETTELGWDFRRYGNGLFGITEFSYGVGTATPPTSWKHGDLLSLSGKTGRGTTSSGQFDAYASRHPVDGTVAVAGESVCWV